MKHTSTIWKKKGEKKKRAGGLAAREFGTKNLWRCSSLQTSGVILGSAVGPVNTLGPLLWSQLQVLISTALECGGKTNHNLTLTSLMPANTWLKPGANEICFTSN